MDDQAATKPASKLEEQATGKKDLSYSYWAANATTSAPPPEPKKLTEEQLREAQNLKHTEIGASAWNSAGTFEERDYSKWAKDQLKGLLAGVEASAAGVSVRVTELASCSGEAHQWIRRQKKSAGFEFSEVQLKWEAQVEEGSLSGTARIPHAAADELDELVLAVGEVDGEAGAEAKARAADAVRALLPALEQQFHQLLKLLCEK